MTRGRRRIPMYRVAQVPPGKAWAPRSLDPADPRTRRLLGFQPRNNQNRWQSHRLIAVDLVLRTDYVSDDRDRRVASTLHEMMCDAEDNHLSVDPQTLLSGHRIDEFIARRYHNDGSWATYRWRLRLVAASVFPPPKETVFKRKPPHAPHTAAERKAYLAAARSLTNGHWASHRSRGILRQDVLRILALSFGAGCNAASLHKATESWLQDDGQTLWLVRPDRTAPFPIPEPWAEILRTGLRGDPEAWLVRPGHHGKRDQQVGKALDRARKAAGALRGFDVDRAARRWQVDLLDACDFDVVAAVCGYRPGRQVPGDLVPFLRQRTDEEMRDIARGWSQ